MISDLQYKYIYLFYIYLHLFIYSLPGTVHYIHGVPHVICNLFTVCNTAVQCVLFKNKNM